MSIKRYHVPATCINISAHITKRSTKVAQGYGFYSHPIQCSSVVILSEIHPTTVPCNPCQMVFMWTMWPLQQFWMNAFLDGTDNSQRYSQNRKTTVKLSTTNMTNYINKNKNCKPNNGPCTVGVPAACRRQFCAEFPVWTKQSSVVDHFNCATFRRFPRTEQTAAVQYTGL